MNDHEVCFYNLPLNESWPKYKLTIHSRDSNATYYAKLSGPYLECIVYDTRHSGYKKLSEVQATVTSKINQIMAAIKIHQEFCHKLETL